MENGNVSVSVSKLTSLIVSLKVCLIAASPSDTVLFNVINQLNSEDIFWLKNQNILPYVVYFLKS